MKYPYPWGENRVETIEEANVLVMGVPFDGAVSNARGAADAPDRMRELSRILPPVTEEGYLFRDLKVYDHGNVEVVLDWQQYFNQVEAQAQSMLKTGKPSIFLGGDHSISIPLEAAFSSTFQQEKIGVIHFDSHPDIVSEYDGHLWSHACTQRRAMELENISPDDLSFIGLRSFMDEELDYLDKHTGIGIYKARDVYKMGPDQIINELSKKYMNHQKLYLTIDIDVLDPAYAPGTGTPESGGLTSRELLELVRGLARELPVAAVDIVEVSPPLDHSDITSWAALKVMYELLGVFDQKKD